MTLCNVRAISRHSRARLTRDWPALQRVCVYGRIKGKAVPLPAQLAFRARGPGLERVRYWQHERDIPVRPDRSW